MDETNIELVNKFINAYNSYDVDAMLSLIHPEISFRNVFRGRVDVQAVGREEFKKFALRSARLFAERRQEIISLLVIQDRVIAEIKYHAIVAHNSSEGFKKGTSIDIDGKSEYSFRDGLISTILDETR